MREYMYFLVSGSQIHGRFLFPMSEAHLTSSHLPLSEVSTGDRIKYAKACLEIGLLDAALFHLRLIPPGDLSLPEVEVLHLAVQHERAARRN